MKLLLRPPNLTIEASRRIIGGVLRHTPAREHRRFQAVGALIVLAAMLLFAVLVFRPTLGTRMTSATVLTPAE